jgi:hypothetical protein
LEVRAGDPTARFNLRFEGREAMIADAVRCNSRFDRIAPLSPAQSVAAGRLPCGRTPNRQDAHASPPPSLGIKRANFEALSFVVSHGQSSSCQLTQHVPHIAYEVRADCNGRNLQARRDLPSLHKANFRKVSRGVARVAQRRVSHVATRRAITPARPAHDLGGYLPQRHHGTTDRRQSSR